MWESTPGMAKNVDEERSVWHNFMSMEDYTRFLGPINDYMGTKTTIGC